MIRSGDFSVKSGERHVRMWRQDERKTDADTAPPVLVLRLRNPVRVIYSVPACPWAFFRPFWAPGAYFTEGARMTFSHRKQTWIKRAAREAQVDTCSADYSALRSSVLGRFFCLFFWCIFSVYFFLLRSFLRLVFLLLLLLSLHSYSWSCFFSVVFLHLLQNLCIGHYVYTPAANSQTQHLGLWCLLVGNGGFLTHGRNDRDDQVLALVKVGLDLVTQLTVWDLDVVLGVTVVGHQRQETVVNVQQLVLGSGHVWNLHVVGGWRQVFQLLTSENVGGNQVDLGVTVLTSLGGGHVDNLTWSTLDDNVTVLSQSRTLHWEGQSGTGISGLKGVSFG
ncbi:eukaryotic translation initiation factor 5A [Clavispora lusitaniae ATCC 42720]|uniref:Eukaryotic translation initiation factor 5A n=1 Tax=Clavispora lusitaniae (strain ATCC 42720) TaxID=306902 RepID=C4YCB4_CLAL4|nr:eukaryotic translation initiation factor 5A [Clavispora lusitaniae ATCC 42720]EEQ41625.1 eukaryotic translation initiation factor 5A [Clavispora lusitaniae ATCC 42720]